MYGDGLERIVEAIEALAPGGATILDSLADDGAVASLLLIHDLYPVPLEERVLEALDTVRPYMESHGGNVELLGIEDGVARLRAARAAATACAASRATLELAIKQALDEHAPDLAGLEVEGVTRAGRSRSASALPLVARARTCRRGRRAVPLVRLDGVERALDRGADGARGRRHAAAGRQRRGLAAGLPRRLRRPAASRSTTATLDGRHARAARPAASSSTCRARAGRLDDEPLQLDAGPAARGRAVVRVAV